MQNNTKKTYFAAANTAQGFVSFYERCFLREDVSRLYMIKGGPGTGKSRFLGDVANEANRLGWKAEYFACSSDPDSLDGVILTHAQKGRIALVDSTPPHVLEPTLPGVRDVIVNLGDFWSREKLAQNAKCIRLLNRQKQEGFLQAYQYLHTAGTLLQLRDGLIGPCVQDDRLARAAARLAKCFPTARNFVESVGFCDSIGMKGRVHLDTHEKNADRVIVVMPFYGIEQIFMQMLYENACEKGCRIQRAPDVLRPDKTAALYFPATRLCITTHSPQNTEGQDVHRVDLRRFCAPELLRDVRSQARFAQKMADSALLAACECFTRAGEYHFELERLYTAAMDFDAKERFTVTFCNAILQNP